ncbi:MAG: hypothetical protein E4H14_06750 [Candidatus Thorarchaeota archaeon]|nr:MAG: hypothetical protein E4H14_06750 [Candidatus Thorarchaeota archaeon]
MEGPHKGLVLGYSSDILVKDVVFKVSEAGRRRVLRNKKKNVHAGVVGTIAQVLNPKERITNTLSNYSQQNWSDVGFPHQKQLVHYNPYKYDSFVSSHAVDTDNYPSNVPIHQAKLVSLRQSGVLAWVFNDTTSETIEEIRRIFREKLVERSAAGETYVVSDNALVAW